MAKTLLESREGLFYDQWESLSTAVRNDLIASRLREYVLYAKTSAPFYKQRLDNFALESNYPLAKVAVLEASELRLHLPINGNQMMADQSGNHTVFQSGGTTGMPKTSLFSHAELEGLNLPNARGFFATGLEAGDRVANLWAVGGLYMTFVHINRMLQQYGCTNFPFSNQTPVDFISTVARSFKINCFTGISSVVLTCLRQMYQNGVRDLEVKKIYFGGEHLYDADKREMQDKFGVEIIMAPGYGTVDTWYLGYQCSECPTGVFHAHDDQVYLEIVNEDEPDASTQMPRHCEAGEVGMLYATAFLRRLTPIIRYRVGDKARWLKDSCSCGRTTPLFQLLGRGDDVLRIGYDSIDYNAVQEVASRIQGLTGAIQMEKRRVEGKDELIIRIESQDLPEKRENLRDQFLATLLDDRPSLRDFVKKGTILPVRIEILGYNELPLNARTGKLIRVIDAI
jgi:phenylacetate-CoA ligase